MQACARGSNPGPHSENFVLKLHPLHMLKLISSVDTLLNVELKRECNQTSNYLGVLICVVFDQLAQYGTSMHVWTSDQILCWNFFIFMCGNRLQMLMLSSQCVIWKRDNAIECSINWVSNMCCLWSTCSVILHPCMNFWPNVVLKLLHLHVWKLTSNVDGLFLM